MAWSLILPLVFAAALIVLFAGWVFTRPKYQLDEVVHLVRKLDTAELARLLDPEEEWAMRNVCSRKEFRRWQRRRFRLAQEYLRRIGHNAEIIQAWTATLYEEIHSKPREDFGPRDYLVREVQEVATEMRVCHLAAFVKVSIWVWFRADYWPTRLIPQLAALRIIAGGDLVRKYAALVEASTSLSLAFGQQYYKQMAEAL